MSMRGSSNVYVLKLFLTQTLLYKSQFTHGNGHGQSHLYGRRRLTILDHFYLLTGKSYPKPP